MANGAFPQLKELILGDEQRELSALRARLEEEERSLVELRDDLEKKRGELSDLRRGLDDQERQLTALRGGLKEKGPQIAALGKGLDGAKGERAKLRQGLEDKERQLTELRAGLKEKGSEITGLQKGLAGGKGEQAKLQEGLKDKERQLTELRTSLEEKGAQIAGLLDGAKGERAELRGDLEDKGRQLTELRGGLEEKGAEISGLRKDLAGSKAEQAALRDGLADKGRQLTELRGGLEEKGTQISGLQAAAEGAKAEQAALLERLEDKSAQLVTLREGLEGAQREQAELRGGLVEKGRRLTELREGLEDKGAQIADLREGLEGVQRDRDELRDSLEEKERALAELRESVEAEWQESSEWRQALENGQSHLVALRQRLDAQEQNSVERLAGDLAAALRRRKEDGPEAFEDLVAAMQAGTESAIQRSVSKDKQPLTKALFPIMGPAIRNYVMDLFRGMVEELNKTIQNATSAERIKWRVQAKLAGKPYSEYVLLKTRSFRVEEVYLMQRDTGLLLLHAAMNSENEAHGEADLVSGMFTAIRSFVRDSFAQGDRGDAGAANGDEEELGSFTFGDREVLIEVGPSLVLAAVAHGVPAPSVRDELKGILENLHAELQGRLDQFSGDTAELEESRPTLRRALIESEAESEESGGGGLWRAWAALGVIALGIAVWTFFSVREQRRWNRFEDALRAQPGMAVTEVKDAGWWRRREVRGVRDPLAADPATLAGDYEVDLEKTSFAFGLMESLEPAFHGPRAAVAEEERKAVRAQLDTLLAELETLRGAQTRAEADASDSSARSAKATESLVRSLFGDIPGLSLEFTDDAIRFRGDLAKDDYELVLSRLEPLKGLGALDTSGLSHDTSQRIAALRRQISSFSIPFREGTLDQENADRLGQLAGLLREMGEVAAKANTSYTFTILAHPLIGTNRAANRLIEERRATQVRLQLVQRGLAPELFETRLSEDLAKAGQGVTVLAVENAREE